MRETETETERYFRLYGNYRRLGTRILCCQPLHCHSKRKKKRGNIVSPCPQFEDAMQHNSKLPNRT